MGNGTSGYELEGTLLEACSCGVLCPCWIGEDPDGGTCDAFNAYHFDSGTIAGVDVGGLNYVRVVKIPGNVLVPQSWTQVVFVDEDASDEQRQALVDAYDCKLGGPLADLAGLIQRDPRRRDRSDHPRDGGRGRHPQDRRLRLFVDASVRGPGGERRRRFRDSLFSTVPGSPAYVGVADKHKVDLPQYGMTWELEGRNAIQADYKLSYAG